MDLDPETIFPLLVGRLGYSWKEVYLCPVACYQSAAKGLDLQERTEWERTRWLAFENMLLSPFIKAYDKPKNVVQYYRFPWEREDIREHERVELSEDNVRELYRIMDNLNKTPNE